MITLLRRRSRRSVFKMRLFFEVRKKFLEAKKIGRKKPCEPNKCLQLPIYTRRVYDYLINNFKQTMLSYNLDNELDEQMRW